MRDLRQDRRAARGRLVGGAAMLVAVVLSAVGTVAISETPAQAAGACPSGWVIQRAIWPVGSYTVYVFSTANYRSVVGKVVNRGANDIDARADHYSSSLGRAVVHPGQSWCSNTSGQPITAWASPVSDTAWGGPYTYPKGAQVSGANG
jgi:hypothetical protein